MLFFLYLQAILQSGYNQKNHQSLKFYEILQFFAKSDLFSVMNNYLSNKICSSCRNQHKALFLHFSYGTKFEIHDEYLRGTIIFASNNFFTSFSITGSNVGLSLLSFYLKGLVFGFRGILC